MIQFLLGVLPLAANFLGVSQAIEMRRYRRGIQGLILAIAFASSLLLPISFAAADCVSAIPPPTIKTICDLQNITNKLAGNYVIANDIDASETAGWNGGTGFVPIGDDVNQFTGVLDGKGYTISNLTTQSPKTYVGLFGYVGVNGTIANVNITNSNPVYTGPVNSGIIGVLAGGNDGRIIDCYTSGTLSSRGGLFGGLVGFTGNPGIVSRSSSSVNIAPPDTLDSLCEAGGLVGFNTGVISNSHASGGVRGGAGSSGFVWLGGLVGYNSPNGFCCSGRISIDRSWASGSVTGTGPGYVYVGGLVGYQASTRDSRDYIRGSYATGAVSSTGAFLDGATGAGGLIGNSAGTVFTSYATGSVTSTNGPVGGLVGYGVTGFYDQTYATGAVSGPANMTGGLVGRGTGFTHSYWDIQTTGQTTSAAGVGLTTAQLKAVLPSGFDPTVWGIHPPYTYPYLKAFLVTFPVKDFSFRCNNSMCTAYNTNITSVMDHSGTPLDPNSATRRDTWYTPDKVVTAYTGENGLRLYGEDATKAPGYKKDYLGSNFSINGHYVGAEILDATNCGIDTSGNIIPNCTCKATSTCAKTFLNYDGHSGYDYPFSPGTIIVAPATGQLYKAEDDLVNISSACETAGIKGWKRWHSFYIVQGTGSNDADFQRNGYSTWYLHADRLAPKVDFRHPSKRSRICSSWRSDSICWMLWTHHKRLDLYSNSSPA